MLNFVKQSIRKFERPKAKKCSGIVFYEESR